MHYSHQNIIFCLSYVTVPQTLQILEDKKGECIVITNVISIQNLLVDLYSKEMVYFLPAIDRILSHNPFTIIKNFVRIYKSKRQVRKDLLKSRMPISISSLYFLEPSNLG